MERELQQLRTSYDITVRDVMCLDSSNIRPEEWQLIAQEIFEQRTDYDGIVVSHGTDTMAYTASAVTFMLPNIDRPVVFTGSQLPLRDILSDGPDNLRTAFAMAASGKSGVFLAFDRKVMLGCRAVKVRASGFSAFESVNARYAAQVSNLGLVINERPCRATMRGTTALWSSTALTPWPSPPPCSPSCWRTCRKPSSSPGPRYLPGRPLGRGRMDRGLPRPQGH